MMVAQRSTICTAFAGLMILASPPRLPAVVQTIDGTVTSEVKEFLPEQTNSELAFKDLEETTQTLPMIVTAQLTQVIDGSPKSGGFAQTIFSDPRLSTLPDPNEFGINLVSAGDLPNVAYSGRCEAAETRRITFLSEEIQADDGSALEAESQFFVDGVILIVGRTGQTDLSSTRAALRLTVQRAAADLSSPVTVLEAGLTLTGSPNGDAVLSTSGVLESDNILRLNLSNLVPELDPVHLIIIPNIAISYKYNANVGESFTLQAQIDAEIESGPRCGAAVVLGVPLTQVAELIDAATDGQAGDVLDQLISASLATNTQPLKPLPAKAQGTTVTVLSGTNADSTPRCALFGLESLLAAAGLGFVGLRRRHNR